MEQGFPRTPLNGSALVGLLTQMALVDGQGARPSFIEGMGRWLGWADAIPLSAALQVAPAAAERTARPERLSRPAARLEAALQTVTATPEYRAFIAANGNGEIINLDGKQTAAMIASEIARYRTLVKSLEGGK